MRKKWKRVRITFAAIALTMVIVGERASGEIAPTDKTTPPVQLTSIDALQDRAVFTFAVMSDHKGDAPSNSIPMKNCVAQIRKLNPRFIIGLGDHVKRRGDPRKNPNPFLKFLKKNPFWRRNFYPNIADGENEYYGKSQADWGAGRKFLDEINLTDRPEVTLRANGCEYYARIPVGPYRIHLVQLHYSDKPLNPKKAFREDSRNYMIRILKKIQKKPDRDLVIVAAHTGNWPKVLSPVHRKILLKKADLVFGATTHVFGRYPYGNDKALVLDTGSVGYALGPYQGWLSAHVLADPFAVVIQYQNTATPRLTIVKPNLGFIKVVGGRTFPIPSKLPSSSKRPAR